MVSQGAQTNGVLNGRKLTKSLSEMTNARNLNVNSIESGIQTEELKLYVIYLPIYFCLSVSYNFFFNETGHAITNHYIELNRRSHLDHHLNLINQIRNSQAINSTYRLGHHQDKVKRNHQRAMPCHLKILRIFSLTPGIYLTTVRIPTNR